MSGTMTPKTDLKFPVMPLPAVWDPAQRLQGLKDSLNQQSPDYFHIEAILPNLRAVIKAYETGQMPSSGTVYFKRGEIVSEEEAANQDAMVWAEVRPSKFSHISPHLQVFAIKPG
jgi:hypothetical protein